MGTYRELEEKNRKSWKIGVLIIYALLFLTMYVFNTYLHEFTARTSTFNSIAGGLVMLLSGILFAFIGEIQDKLKTNVNLYLMFLILLGIGIGWACGFNFSLDGVAEIK